MALGTAVILREIFGYLPTKLLLVTCSLVDKVWNKESRRFIRDHRRCGATGWAEPRKEYTVLQLLTQLDNQCRQIAENGRLVPWNYMVLPGENIKECGKICSTDEIDLGNLTGGIQLKYLEISGNVEDVCACSKLIAWLLTKKSYEVEILIMRSNHV